MKKNIIIGLLIAAAFITSACTQNKNTVAWVGESQITQAEFEYYLNNIKTQMAGTELSSDEDWQTKEIEGEKAIDLAKKKSLDAAVENLSYIEIGKKAAPLTEDEEKQVDTLKNNIITAYGDTSKYNQYLKELGITDSFIDMLCESEMYRKKLTNKVSEDNEITDDMLNATFKEKYRRAKHILILTQDMTTGLELSDEQKSEALKKAQSLLQRVQSGEDFDALISEFGEDPGTASNPDGYVFTDGEMVTEFQDGVDSLGFGEVTLVKTSYGYHIIKRLPLDETPELYNKFFESKKDDVKSLVLNDLLEKQMDIWKTEYDIKVKSNDELYNSIN